MDNKSVELQGRSRLYASGLVRISDGTTPIEPQPMPEILREERSCEAIWIFAELTEDISPTNEVVLVCDVYLTLIEKLVDECERKFLVK